MGIFALPPKLKEDCTAKELIETAEANIKIYLGQVGEKDNDWTYLLRSFALGCLEDAKEKLDEK